MSRKQEIITKISPPSLHDVLNRTRLFDVIEQYRSYPVIWVSGLPGSGKTTLAASYLQCRKIPSIWYQVDRNDSDASSFFYYLTRAAIGVSKSAQNGLPALAPEHFANLHNYAGLYFRELFSLLPNPSVIVLDNYQELAPDSEIQLLIKAGMEAAPPGINIIVLSRSTPPTAFSRLVMNRKIAIIQHDEMALTRDESVAIADLYDKWKASLGSVPLLLERTGGWAAGFVLMLEYSHPETVADDAPGDMAREFFFNYFAGEILHKLQPDVRDFLLMTSLLPSFSVDDAKELTGFTGAENVLADMYRRNYFIEKKTTHGISYQFHPLFREFLLSELEVSLPGRDVFELSRNAATILVKNGQLEEAYQIYATAGDYDSQADLIRVYGRELIAKQRLQLLGQWLRELPHDLLASDPRLLVLYGQCRLPFDPAESSHLFARAHDLFQEEDDRTGMVITATGILETILTEWGVFKRMDPWIEKLGHFLKDTTNSIVPDIEARAVIAMFTALMYRQPQHPDIRIWEKRALGLLRSDINRDLRILAGGYLSHYSYWVGDIFKAEMIIDIVRELMQSLNLSPLVLITIKMQEAVHGWHVADFDKCLESVSHGLEEAEKSGVHILDNWLLAQGVYASLSSDKPETARAFLDKMKPIVRTKRYLDIAHFYFLSAMYYLHIDKVELARQHNAESLRYVSRAGALFPQGLGLITEAQIIFATGDIGQAEELNLQARKIGEAMQSYLLLMLSCQNEAYFSLQKGKAEEAVEALREFLTIRKNKGMLNFSGWRPRVIQELYALALEKDIETDFVRECIFRRNLLPDRPSSAINKWPWHIQIATLGSFAVVIDGAQLCFKRKAQLKPLEMLKMMIAAGGKGVSQSRIENCLWPDVDGDRARQAFVTTLHRLRRLLHYDNVVELRAKKLWLNERYCRLDLWEFDRLCSDLTAMIKKNITAEELDALTDSLLRLYRGDFLQDEEEYSWILQTRARYKNTFSRAIVCLAEVRERKGEWLHAVELYQQALAVDDTAEEFYQGQMKCYHAQGRMAEGIAVYNQCCQVLESVLQTVPSPKTRSLFYALKQQSNQ